MVRPALFILVSLLGLYASDGTKVTLAHDYFSAEAPEGWAGNGYQS
jgi:hypothetical protein